MSEPNVHSNLPELIALIADPQNVTEEFVAGAIEHQVLPHVPEELKRAKDCFVRGEFPIFFAQFAGQLFQLKFMPLPYFDEKCSPFVNGDLEALNAAIEDRELRRAVKRHRGWISVALMTPGADPDDGENYVFLSRLLAALVLVSDTLAIIWPPGDRISVWDFDLLEDLETANLPAIFP